jgi:hypothetical protein
VVLGLLEENDELQVGQSMVGLVLPSKLNLNRVVCPKIHVVK